jgi:hypothetical protein
MWVSKGALCVGLSLAVGAIPTSARSEGAGPICRLEVLLTTTSTLPESARNPMMAEVEDIWRNHGVVIDWLPGTADRPISQDRLRVLVVEHRKSAAIPSETITVGELLRPVNGHPLAIISVENAERLVAVVRDRSDRDLIAVDQLRLGLVLGRAMAHEIGHYLLDTHTHASHGLMRPQFDALEFTDIRDGTFALDRPASDWLKSRLANNRFAYAK